MKRRVFLSISASAITFAFAACGTDEPLGTGPSTISDAGVDVPTPPSDAGNDAGPVVRTVETRPRFGPLDPGNALLDGDFEYSGMDAVQYPWFGLEHDFIVTGARCKRGLRCVEVPHESYIFGLFMWPDAGTIDVAYYAKPLGSGSCSDEVGGIVLPLEEYPGAPQDFMVVSATNPDPEPSGWCHVETSLTVPTDTGNVLWALLLAPRQDATGAILVDDTSIRVAGSSRGSAKARPASAELAKLAARARSDFAKRPPPPPRRGLAPIENRTGRRGR